MTEPIYLTSFGLDMYNGTGRAMLESFAKVRGNARMRICYENPPGQGDVLGNELRKYDFVDLYCLDNDKFLQDWLRDNADIIPTHLGGKAQICDCPNAHEMHAKHKHACHWQWMNRNASRWFRKVASWLHATQVVVPQTQARFVLWFDCDTKWNELPNAKALTRIGSEKAVSYAKSQREAIESGIVLFDFERGANIVLLELCRLYMTDFRQLHRWDDGYVLTVVTQQLASICQDLVPPWPPGQQPKNNVMPFTPWAKYLTHLKGSHGRKLGIMK